MKNGKKNDTVITGQQLRDWREHLGLRTEELAVALGVGLPTVYRNEQRGLAPISGDMQALITSEREFKVEYVVHGLAHRYKAVTDE